MTVVSHRHRVIFLKTRKTAGTSIELWLSTIAGASDVLAPIEPRDEARRAAVGPSAQNFAVPVRRYGPRDVARHLAGRPPRFVNHMPAVDVRRYVGRQIWSDYLKVTVERNAYDRAVSMFRWHTRDTPGADLVDFLRAFPARKLANAPIYSIGSEVIADVVLDHARLEQDLRALQRRLGVVEVPLPLSKVSAVRTADSKALLGPDGCLLVDQACRHDVALSLPDKRPEAGCP